MYRGSCRQQTLYRESLGQACNGRLTGDRSCAIVCGVGHTDTAFAAASSKSHSQQSGPISRVAASIGGQRLLRPEWLLGTDPQAGIEASTCTPGPAIITFVLSLFDRLKEIRKRFALVLANNTESFGLLWLPAQLHHTSARTCLGRIK